MKAVKRKQCKAGVGICFVPPLVPADGADENNNYFHEVLFQAKQRKKQSITNKRPAAISCRHVVASNLPAVLTTTMSLTRRFARPTG